MFIATPILPAPNLQESVDQRDMLVCCCRQSGNYDLLILAQTKGLNATVLNAARDVAIPVAVALISNRYPKAAQPHAHCPIAPRSQALLRMCNRFLAACFSCLLGLTTPQNHHARHPWPYVQHFADHVELAWFTPSFLL